MPDWDPRALAARFGPFAVLLLVAAFMLWVRLIPADRVITDSAVFFSGNDPWYHNRMVHYAVQNFPATPEFDPWSYFPYGTGRHSGFGGLFDQLIALGALVVGLGGPDEHLVDVVTAVAPPAFGALTAVPTYVIARRLTDRWWALVAAGLLALTGGGLFARTIVGSADHQSAEALFGAIAVAGFAYAVATAHRESPMLEDVQDRNWDYLQPTVVAGILGGVAVASYLALWPPGVMLLFTFGVFVVIQLAREHAAGSPTDPLAMGTIVTMTTAGVLTLANANTLELQSTAFSLLQPLVAFGLAVGTAVLFGLSRYAEREGYARDRYPVAVLGLIVGSLLVTWVVFPRAIGLLQSLFVRVYSLGYFTSITAGTVAEIQPASVGQAFGAYGTILVLAAVGMLFLATRVYRERRPVDLLVLLWSVTMTMAYFTMARFGYYFSVNVAVLGGVAVWWVAVRWLEVDLDPAALREREVDVYQLLGLLVILVLVVPGNVVAVSGSQPVWQAAESPVYSGADQAWYDGLEWMESNTPEQPLDQYVLADRPADGDYAYPDGTYGVMSWWDYGHWITVIGERIPYANPFQENPRPASAFFQATNETRANLILEALPSLADDPSQAAELSNDELRDLVAEQSTQQANEDGRYVVIDDQMAGGKFLAITQWAGPGVNTYFQQRRVTVQGQNFTLPMTSQRYEDTMLGRLYFDDASGLEHYRLVHEVGRYSLVGSFIQGNRVRQLDSTSLRGDWESMQADQLPTAIRRGRQRGVATSLGGSQFVYNAHVESSVKTYERVEGARLTGTVPNASAGTPVFARLELQTHTGRNFTYLQQVETDADGSFELTVPYATDDTVDPADGGTDASVEARGEYTVSVGTPISGLSLVTGSTAVPEPAIYDGRTIEVDLERRGGNETAQTSLEAPAGAPIASGP